MSNLESKTLDQILEVIRISKVQYFAGILPESSYRKAIHEVACTYNVTYQTIVDGCRRRLGLSSIEEFKDLLVKYFNNNPTNLISLFKQHTDTEEQHNKIDQFFQVTSAGDTPLKKIMDKPISSAKKTSDEVISFRLDCESTKKLNALANLKGVSVPEWVAETVRKVSEEQLKEWAKTYSNTP